MTTAAILQRIIQDDPRTPVVVLLHKSTALDKNL